VKPRPKQGAFDRGNCRQMDLSGPGIDVKLKERKKDRVV